MSIETVKQGEEFSGNTQLWVIPQPNAFALSARMDWLLNGLITHAEDRVPQKLHPDLLKILKAEELEMTQSPQTSSDTLLIDSSKFLPNKFVMLSVFNGDEQDWLNRILKKWEDLKSPSLRIFLPKGVSASSASKLLKKNFSGAASLELVEAANE